MHAYSRDKNHALCKGNLKRKERKQEMESEAEVEGDGASCE